MIESLLGISTGFTLTDLGVLAALVTIIVEVLKSVLSKSFPTQILVVIVSLLLGIGACFLFYGVVLKAALLGLLLGFITAFISMKGFDGLKEVFNRFIIYNYNKVQENENGDNSEG